MLKKFINFIEDSHLEIWHIVVLIIGFGLLRSCIEMVIFGYNWGWGSVENLLHTTSYYLFLSCILLLILKISTGEKIDRILNAMSKFYWIIIIPPFIDKFLFNYVGYSYLQPGEFYKAVITFIDIPPYVGVGQRVEILIILLLVAVYIFSKKKPLWKGLLFSVVSFFLFYVSIIYFSTPLLNPIFNLLVDEVSSNFYWIYSQWILFFFFMTSSLLLLLISFSFDYRNLSLKIIYYMKNPKSLLLLSILIFGLKLSSHTLSFDAVGYWNLIASILSILSIILFWLFIQSGKNYMGNFAHVTIFLSLFISAILGSFQFMLFLFMLILGHLFNTISSPYFRVFETPIFSILIFIFGILTPKFGESYFIPPKWYLISILIFIQLIPLGYQESYGKNNEIRNYLFVVIIIEYIILIFI